VLVSFLFHFSLIIFWWVVFGFTFLWRKQYHIPHKTSVDGYKQITIASLSFE